MRTIKRIFAETSIDDVMEFGLAATMLVGFWASVWLVAIISGNA